MTFLRGESTSELLVPFLHWVRVLQASALTEPPNHPQVLIRTFFTGGDNSNWIDALELPHYSAQNMPGIAFMVANHLRQCKWVSAPGKEFEPCRTRQIAESL
jgi:hypothetical protein